MKNKGKRAFSKVVHEHKEGCDGLLYKTCQFGDTQETVCRDPHGRLRCVQINLPAAQCGPSCDEPAYGLRRSNNACSVGQHREMPSSFSRGAGNLTQAQRRAP